MQHSVDICIPAESGGQPAASQPAAEHTAMQRGWGKQHVSHLLPHMSVPRIDSLRCSTHSGDSAANVSAEFRACLRARPSPSVPAVKASAFPDRADMLRGRPRRNTTRPHHPHLCSTSVVRDVDALYYILFFFPASNALLDVGVCTPPPTPTHPCLTAVCQKPDVFYAFPARRRRDQLRTLK